MIIQQSAYFLNQEYSCRIPHYSIVNKKVFYVVLFISISQQLVKVHHMRYSDAEKLHIKIDKAAQQLRIQLQMPHFPGKKLFGSHNDTTQGILQRKQELQDYFNLLLRQEKLYSVPLLKSLLPETPQEELKKFQQENKSEQQYNFIIDSYQQLEDRVLYFIQVIDNFHKNKWRFKIRYSDLRDIHEAMKEIKKNLPEFPKRKIFGITNDDPQEIEQRKKGLESYLNLIFKDKELTQSEVLNYFIQNSKRESKKLQRYDEQKLLLKMKMKARQLQEEPRKSNSYKQQFPKKGLFVIKEINKQQEDDNTTLIRYTPLSLNTSNPLLHQKVNIDETSNHMYSSLPQTYQDEVIDQENEQNLNQIKHQNNENIQQDNIWIMDIRQHSQSNQSIQ